MSNAAITGGIIAAQKQKTQQALPKPYYSQPILPTQNPYPIKFGMGWSDDLDDAKMRLYRIQNDPEAEDWAKVHAAEALKDVKASERLGERRKARTEVLSTMSGASFGMALGPVGAAIAGVTGFVYGKLMSDMNKESSYHESLVDKLHGEAFKRGRARIIDGVAKGTHKPSTYTYYDRFGYKDSVTITDRQAEILRKNPSGNSWSLHPDTVKQIDKVKEELDYYKDIKKDPDYSNN